MCNNNRIQKIMQPLYKNCNAHFEFCQFSEKHIFTVAENDFKVKN